MQKHPRKVTKEDIEAFEKQYPAYGKIGKAMLEAGIWCLVESKEDKQKEKHGSQNQNKYHSTLTRTANINLSGQKINHPIPAGVKN
ncbi:hypothetical protein F1737_08790 [Methanoplanus sp. FWC-SCC4]|uniref:Uncharacterized protein n=2 Tax=Methanochimaera problematica TaxID=2609417 RepID=A0AA97FD60_9EURY|nr:hypothetical protein F1737_08790 [Methanoplanus sp. FWC-SCC4]